MGHRRIANKRIKQMLDDVLPDGFPNTEVEDRKESNELDELSKTEKT